jgi:hypothetical protein
MDNFKIPPIPKELLTMLEERFSDRMPENATTIENYLLKQGQLSVIRFLRHQFNLQNTTVLEK